MTSSAMTAMSVALVAMVLTILLGFVHGMRRTMTSGLGLISVSLAVAILSFAVAVIVSIVSGTLPISGALNTPPAIALRKVV
jgi:ABC-type antimicrobial peptide transport system permease subunit